MATKQFGDKGQYTYNIDADGNPYGAPITVSETPKKEETKTPLGESETEANDVITTIQDKLLEQTGLISSQNAEIEKGIGKAIESVRGGAESSTKAIESAYAREKDFAEMNAEADIQNQLEGRAGFATQMVAFRNLVETTDKNLKDLAMRKNELILQNNAQAASQIANLEVQALQFKQTATQNVFSNLLSMGNLALAQKSEDRLAKQQSFAEKQAINSIALQYGVTVQPGDTLDSITTRVAPYASEEQKLNIAKMRAEISRANAETNKIINGVDGAIDDTVAASLAQAYRSGQTQFLAGLKSSDDLAKVYGEISKQQLAQNDYIASKADEFGKLGSVAKIKQALSNDKNIIITTDEADKIANDILAASKISRGSTTSSSSKLFAGQKNTTVIKGYNPITPMIVSDETIKKIRGK